MIVKLNDYKRVLQLKEQNINNQRIKTHLIINV